MTNLDLQPGQLLAGYAPEATVPLPDPDLVGAAIAITTQCAAEMNWLPTLRADPRWTEDPATHNWTARLTVQVTEEMIAAGFNERVRWNTSAEKWLPKVYLAMARLAPKDNGDPGGCLRIELGALKTETDYERRSLRELIAALEAENRALKAALDLSRVTIGDPTPADLPDPPRRPDGTLLPQPKPWIAPKPGATDSRRVGS